MAETPGRKIVRLEPDGSASVTEDGVTVPDLGLGADEPTSAIERRAVSQTSAAAATNMRIAGASYPEIAKTLEYASAGQARAVVEKTLAGAYQVEDRETLFRVTAARLDALTKVAYVKATSDTIEITDPETGDVVSAPNRDQIAWSKLLLDVLGRHSKLHGLDAPTQVLINPSAEEFNRVVATLARQTEDDVIEADVFDAEIVEEGELE